MNPNIDRVSKGKKGKQFLEKIIQSTIGWISKLSLF